MLFKYTSGYLTVLCLPKDNLGIYIVRHHPQSLQGNALRSSHTYRGLWTFRQRLQEVMSLRWPFNQDIWTCSVRCRLKAILLSPGSPLFYSCDSHQDTFEIAISQHCLPRPTKVAPNSISARFLVNAICPRKEDPSLLAHTLYWLCWKPSEQRRILDHGRSRILLVQSEVCILPIFLFAWDVAWHYLSTRSASQKEAVDTHEEAGSFALVPRHNPQMESNRSTFRLSHTPTDYPAREGNGKARQYTLSKR